MVEVSDSIYPVLYNKKPLYAKLTDPAIGELYTIKNGNIKDLNINLSGITPQASSATFIPISNSYYVQTNGYGTMVGIVDGDTFTQAQTEEGDYIYIGSTNTDFIIRDAEGNELYLPLKDSDGHNLLRNDALGDIVYWNNDELVPIQYNGNSVYIEMM